MLSIRGINIEDTMGREWIEIRVTDQGCGIPDDKLPQIFDLFFTTKNDGHGLGLPFVKAFIQQLEGTIKVVTTLGQGTTFILRIPAC